MRMIESHDINLCSLGLLPPPPIGEDVRREAPQAGGEVGSAERGAGQQVQHDVPGDGAAGHGAAAGEAEGQERGARGKANGGVWRG